MLLSLEILAVVLGLAYVVLVILENKWCWIFGGLSSLLYVVLYLPQKLLVFVSLNLIYAGMAIAGFLRWSRPAVDGEKLMVRRMDIPRLAMYMLAAVGAAGGIFVLLKLWAFSAFMAFESVAGGAALAAMLATIEKYLENWLFWMVSNITYVILFFLSGNFPTAILYCAFTLLALIGYINWRNKYYAHVA